MSAPFADSRLLLFDGEEHPPDVRFDAWRDILSRKLLRVAMDPLNEGPFVAKAAMRVMPQLRVAYGSFGPTIHHRTRNTVALENDDLALIVNLGATILLRQRDAELRLQEGQACLVECCEAGSYVVADSGRLLVLRISRAALGPFAARAEEAIGRVMPVGAEPFRLLVPYACAIPTGGEYLSPAMIQAATDHVSDLVALTLGARGDAAVAAGRGLGAARLAAAKAFVRAHIGPEKLSGDIVAAALGISARYLRQLFETDDLSFSSYVLEQRLRRAYATLTSARHADKSISAIALHVGFGDLSYFNRAFRRRFDRTPRDVSAEAARAWRPS